MKLTSGFASLLLAVTVVNGLSSLRPFGPQSVNLWKLKARLDALAAHPPRLLVAKDGVTAEFSEYHFTQPIDHSDPSMGTFEQRYWISTRHYLPGFRGPVIVLDGGETSGEDRLPFLDTGIVDILANATAGIGVVLEHRYYGLLSRCGYPLELQTLIIIIIVVDREIHPRAGLQH